MQKQSPPKLCFANCSKFPGSEPSRIGTLEPSELAKQELSRSSPYTAQRIERLIELDFFLIGVRFVFTVKRH